MKINDYPNNLKEYFNYANLSKEKFAEKCYISVGTLKRLLSQSYNPTMRMAFSITSAVNSIMKRKFNRVVKLEDIFPSEK